jgi:hypothetical protein
MFPEINTMADGTSVTPYEGDVRDPSMFFIVYETGDNTTVAEGEAVPLDLFYSRAYEYGDEYDYVEVYKDKDGDGTAEVVEEWDWLENKAEDLSGEASVTANPGATFFYSVWNQWQEPEEDVIEESDIWFRRVMYIDTDDGLPTAAILYTARTVGYDAGDLEFIGTAVDNDHMGDEGIVDYLWTSSIDGVLSNQKSFIIPAAALTPGFHTITFTAQDDEGNWAREVSTMLFVAEELHQIYLPLVNNP